MNAITYPTRLSVGIPSLTRVGYITIAVLMIVVFEGAVRKWFAASATLPLVLARDLLAAYLIFYVWKQGYFRKQKNLTMAMTAWTVCVVAWGMLQLILGQSSPVILVIGLRFWLLYLWFGYAAASAMSEADFRAFILTIVGLLLLMAPLAVAQYYSPPGARINSEVDSYEDDIFVAVAGVVRTTGTFSFTLGYTTFLATATPLVLAVLAARKRNLRQLLFGLAVFVMLVVGTVVSGSRAAVLFSGGMLGVYLLAQLVFARARDKGKALITAIIVLLLVALFALIFQNAIETTQQRFEDAAAAESFWERVLTIFIGEPNVYADFNWLGYGLGYGSNLASYVRTGSTLLFALVETEGGRTLLEGGLLGYLFTGLKIVVLALGLWKSLQIAIRTGVVFPMLIWLTLVLALMTWPGIGQLSANPLLGMLFGLALLALRYPNLEIFRRRLLRR